MNVTACVWLVTSLLLYALGAVLMHTRLALLDDIQLSDMPAVTSPAAVPMAVPLTVAVVALWPIAVVVCAWLAIVLLRPRTTRKPGRCARPGPSTARPEAEGA